MHVLYIQVYFSQSSNIKNLSCSGGGSEKPGNFQGGGGGGGGFWGKFCLRYAGSLDPPLVQPDYNNIKQTNWAGHLRIGKHFKSEPMNLLEIPENGL